MSGGAGRGWPRTATSLRDIPGAIARSADRRRAPATALMHRDVRMPREGRKPEAACVALGRCSRRGSTSCIHAVVPPAIRGGRRAVRDSCVPAHRRAPGIRAVQDAQVPRRPGMVESGDVPPKHPWRNRVSRVRRDLYVPVHHPLANRESLAARDYCVPAGHKKPGSRRVQKVVLGSWLTPFTWGRSGCVRLGAPWDPLVHRTPPSGLP
jgi:hypothetical protein